MLRGRSRVLINEFALPARGAPWGATSLDLLMMVVMTARERPEAQWREIAHRASLKLVKVWTFDPGCESIIEMELPPDGEDER